MLKEEYFFIGFSGFQVTLIFWNLCYFSMLTEAYNLFADVCLVIGAGHKIHAHKVVLCQRSTYFENTLQGHNRAKYFMYFKHPKVRD